MRVDLFDFELPNERIALHPVVPRDAARMLVVDPNTDKQKKKTLLDANVSEFIDHLKAGDAVVFNDTKVMCARLEGYRYRRARDEFAHQGEHRVKISATLHRRVSANEWKAFIRPGKRLKKGDRLIFSNAKEDTLEAIVQAKGEGGEVSLSFICSAQELGEKIETVGHIPLPPYIASKRDEVDKDTSDYQTIYAKHSGAVAAPTAGLHFTDQVFADLKAKGVSCHFVTLHIGAGTFVPVKVDDTKDHIMHEEIGFVSESVACELNKIRNNGGKIVSIGTTSLRLLESATDKDGFIRSWSGPTNIFITPGYKFRAVDMLLTNFHLPKSTLFMLVSAFSGLDIMQLSYKYAIENGYRFYSYGDASLLFKA